MQLVVFLEFKKKRIFFLRLFWSTKSLHKKRATQNRIFGPCHHRAQTHPRRRRRRSQASSSTNEPLFFSTRKTTTTFLRRRETTTKKSADVHEVLGVFVGSVSGEELSVFFKNLCAFFSERERERERERDRKRSDRAKNDAAR